MPSTFTTAAAATAAVVGTVAGAGPSAVKPTVSPEPSFLFILGDDIGKMDIQMQILVFFFSKSKFAANKMD